MKLEELVEKYTDRLFELDESEIRMYLRYYNMKVSFELDDKTLQFAKNSKFDYSKTTKKTMYLYVYEKDICSIENVPDEDALNYVEFDDNCFVHADNIYCALIEDIINDLTEDESIIIFDVDEEASFFIEREDAINIDEFCTKKQK